MTMTIKETTNIAPATWSVDPAHTQVEFEVKHMMFAKVRGRFGTVEGGLTIAADGEPGSSTSIKIDSASIDTGQAQRDEHLRSADFFDVERFPVLTFESTGVVNRANGPFRIEGDLTIRDVTRRVELDVVETGTGIDPWGQERIGFTASTTVDRRDFGLNWNQALEAGGVLVGHDVRITIEVQAVRSDD